MRICTLFIALVLVAWAGTAWSQSNGDVRLSGGETANTGVVEIYHDQDQYPSGSRQRDIPSGWYALCDDFMDQDNADVACKAAGYSEGAQSFEFLQATNTTNFLLDNVNCSGSETSLLDCPRHNGARVGEHNCRAWGPSGFLMLFIGDPLEETYPPSTQPGVARIYAEGVGVTCAGTSNSPQMVTSADPPVIEVIETDLPADGNWDAGDTLTLEVRFDREVEVDTTNGTPTLTATVGTASVAVPYTSGSSSNTLVFSTTLWSGTVSSATVLVAANALALNGGTIKSEQMREAVLTHVALAFTASGVPDTPLEESDPVQEEQGTMLAAAFEDGPSRHDGSSTFTIELAFTEAVFDGTESFNRNARIADVVSVTNGTLTGRRRVNPQQYDRWRLWIRPSGNGDVTVTLPATTGGCDAAGAICTPDGTPLSEDATATIEGPELTSSFGNVPAEHDGSSVFSLELAFSHEVFDGTESFDKNGRIADAVSVTNGTLTGRRRVDPQRYDRWILRIRPSGNGNIIITLPPTTGGCGGTNAICTPGGISLSGTATATIQGPPGLSVADAEVQEGSGATLAFAVTLSRASSSAVTVDYATSDGSATAGVDYTATSGTLSFEAGETAKTVSVPVIDDGVDDDGETLTLVLSNPSGGNAYLSDGTGTGTIRNRDPLQREWIARFGRAVGSQAVEAVTGRMGGGGQTHVTLGGRSLPLGKGSSAPAGAGGETDPDLPDTDESSILTHETTGGIDKASLMTHERKGPAGEVEKEAGAVEKLVAEWLRSGVREDESLVLPDLDTLILGSSFNLSLGEEKAGPGSQRKWSAWGRFARDSFEGSAEGVVLEGDVTTGFVGMDAESGSWLWGAALGISEGEGPFRMSGNGTGGETATTEDEKPGRMESRLTAVYPYGRHSVTDRLDLWAMAGYGQGTMSVESAGAPALETDLGLTLGAVGARGTLKEPPAGGGIALVLRADALWVRTESEALASDHGFLSGAVADTSRVRLILEGRREYRLGNGGTITPSLELGFRRDGGDAETGTGIETAAHISFKRQGLTIEGAVRTLLSHEDEEYGEWGASAAVRLEPGSDGRGLWFSVSPSWGATGSAAERLWGLDDTRGLAPDGEFEAGRRIDAKAGYGMPVFGGRFTGTPELGMGLSDGSRDYRVGWRLTPAGGGIGPFASFGITMEAAREFPSRGDPESRFGAVLEARF